MLKINQELKDHIWKLKKEEYDQLEQNILKEGIRDAIITWNGYIIDGHNRYEIAQKHNLNYKTIEMIFVDIEEVKDWMDANQLGRRNLTEDQWQISIGRRYNREKKAIGRPENNCANIAQLNTKEYLAEEYKISPRTIMNYSNKAKEYEKLKKEKPEIAEKIETGEMSFKEIKKEEKIINRQKEIEAIIDKINNENIIVKDKYDVVILDPPWKYNRNYDPDGSRVANPYPEQTKEEIYNTCKDLFKENSVLWLWTTHAFIWQAKELLEMWGFEYKSILVWNKDKIGMGSWLRMQCEFCLLGIKGDVKGIYSNTTKTDIIIEKRREHSRKPDMFYEMVKYVCNGTIYEYYSREQRNGIICGGIENDKMGR